MGLGLQNNGAVSAPKGERMKTYLALLEELDGAAEEVYAAQVEYAKKCIAEMSALSILEDYKAEPYIDPTLLASYRKAWLGAYHDRLNAMAEYDVCVDRQRNVRVMIYALTAGRAE